MRILVPIAAGLWLFIVGGQGLAHMARFGLLPLPRELAALDFTPAYLPLLALVLAAAALKPREAGEEQP